MALGHLFIQFLAMVSIISGAEKRPTLILPLECSLGKDCFIQNYVDIDTSNKFMDFSCGKAGYNGHKGVDFRLLSSKSVAKNYNVIASASGVVKALRDGVKDKLYEPSDEAKVKGIECGNGVVILHDNGWETQYCHLKQGSVKVRRGQIVKAGEKL